jgi:pilus assembly protein Flp/PilA
MGETERPEHAADAAGGSAAHPHAARFDLKKLFGIRLFFGDTRGATAIEYALVAGSIAVVIVAAVQTLGQNVNTMFFQQIVAAMQ